MKKQKLFLSIFSAALIYSSANAQLVVNNSAPYNNINYLVQNVLLGTGIQVSNVTYSGAPIAVGYFNGKNSNLNLDSGIVLTSGDIQNAVGPNNVSSQGTANGTPGDAQLEQMTGNPSGNSFDAAIIEFDFLANSDTVKFDYVFGSEEYPEYVNSGFNDAFAFIINGVSVVMPPTNIALLPSSTTAVTINNVNNGTGGLGGCPPTATTGPCMNCSYYIDNCSGSSVQYDGFTTVLTAISAVQCGQMYHIKMVIADMGDGVFDSGVFLKAGSFTSSGAIHVSSNVSYSSLNDSTLYEGCGKACITIDRGKNNLSQSDTVLLNTSGVAINGVDITLLPDTVFFSAGQDSVTICIQGILDTLTEGPENLILTAILLGGNSTCSKGDTATLTLYIDDLKPLSVNASPDDTICPGGSTQIFGNIVGGIQPVGFTWAPSSGLSNPNISNPIASPTVTTSYIIHVADSCKTSPPGDTVVVFVLPPGPVVAASSNITVCLDGTPVNLSSSANGGAVPYSYWWSTVSGADSISPPNSSGPTIIPSGNDLFTVIITDRCGNKDTATAAIHIQDCIITIPNVISADGNGMNDYFAIKNLDKFPNSRLVIYNRWGNKIYDNPDYLNNWDAHGYSEGTYYYVLYRSDDKAFPGFLTVLRK